MTSNISRRKILAGLGATAGLFAAPHIARAQGSAGRVVVIVLALMALFLV